MLPSQSFGSSNNQFQNMFATPAQGSYLPAGPFVQSQPQTIDVNSPELFKHNMQYIMQQIERIQSLIQSSIMGIQNAYQPGNTPAQTEGNIAALKHEVYLLIDSLKQSGVGALPLLPYQSQTTTAGGIGMALDAQVPNEQQLMVYTTKGLEEMYQRQERMQQSATVPADWMDPTKTLDVGR